MSWKRIGQNFGGPNEPGLHVLDDEQVDGAEQHAADAQSPSQMIAT